MSDYSLGPNGAMLYAMEYLEANFDWLEEGLMKLVRQTRAEGRGPGYFVFDTPGQVELWTNHESLKNVVARLVKLDYRVSSRAPADRARVYLTPLSTLC